MERFDISKELKRLEGRNVIDKCSALNALCDTFRDAITEVTHAKERLLEEYESSCRKMVIDELYSDIKATFDVEIPYVDNYGYKASYDGIPTYVIFSCIEGEWCIYFSVSEGSLKPIKELVKRMGGDSETLEIHVSEEKVVSKIETALFHSDLLQTEIAKDKGIIFKYGDLANTVCSGNWKAMPIEALNEKTEWVALMTDNAETYLDEINAIFTKIKHPKTCFVIDLHPCCNYKHLQKLWDNYIMTDKESVEVLLSFIHHHLVNPSMISFFIQDFREYCVPYPFVRATSTEIGKKVPIDSNAKAMFYGLCFEHDCELADSYMNTLDENMQEIDETTGLHWSIQNSTDNVVEALYFYEPKF